MDNLHKALIERSIAHMYDDTYDNPQMITDSKHTECLTCGFYLNAEDIAEIERAYQYAYQYRVNTIRIRRLLEQSPVTMGHGQLLVSTLIDPFPRSHHDILINARTKYINPILIYP